MLLELYILHAKMHSLISCRQIIFQRSTRNIFMSLFPSVLVLFQNKVIASSIHNLVWLSVIVTKGFWQKVVLIWKAFQLAMVGVSRCWPIRLQGGGLRHRIATRSWWKRSDGAFEPGLSSTFLDVDPLFGNYCLNLETPVDFLPTWPSANTLHSSSSFSMAGPLVP